MPHGLAVVATAAAAFRFTFPTGPDRHEEAARMLGHDASGRARRGVARRDRGAVSRSSERRGAWPRMAIGESDVDAIAEGAFAQQRLLAVSPRPATRDDLATIVRQSLST